MLTDGDRVAILILIIAVIGFLGIIYRCLCDILVEMQNLRRDEVKRKLEERVRGTKGSD